MTKESKNTEMEKLPKSPNCSGCDKNSTFVFPEIHGLRKDIITDRTANSAPNSRSCSFRKPKRERLLTLETQRRNSAPFTSDQNLISVSQSDLRKEKLDSLKRVRSFKMTSKGIVNKGDAFRNKSTSSIASSGSTTVNEQETVSYRKRQRIPSDNSEDSAYTTCSCSSGVCSSYYRVGIMGCIGVGKSALINQFMTSEYLGAFDSSAEFEDDATVSVLLDGEESMIEFWDMSKEQENILADAYVVVFSVDNHDTFEFARESLHTLRNDLGSDRAIILVANKIDLVRNRQVTSSEARRVADVFDCKYIETSVTLNHHVDELLVGLLRQIRLKLFHNDSCHMSSDTGKVKSKKLATSKGPKGLLNKIFRRNSKTDKSCENLFEL